MKIDNFFAELKRCNVYKVYIALGRKEDAIRLARQTVDLLPPEKNSVAGSSNLTRLAEIRARTGAASEAVVILRKLLSMSACATVSIARLKIDPVWDPIRNDPGFQQLLTSQEHVGPEPVTAYPLAPRFTFQHVTVLVSFIFAIALTHGRCFGERTRPRVLVAAPSLQRTFRATGAASLGEEKSAMTRTSSPAREGACAPQTGPLRADRHTNS